MIRTALKFAGSSGDRLSMANTTSFTNFNIGSMCCWIYLTGTGLQRMAQKGTGLTVAGTAHAWMPINSGTTAQVTIARATTVLNATANLSAFTNYGQNKPLCYAAVWDTGGSTLPKVYYGDLNRPLEEPSSYTAQNAGAGTVGNDSADTFTICNSSAANAAIPGFCWVIAFWSRVLPINQLREWAYNPVSMGTVGMWWPGKHGLSGPVTDESGRGNNLIITTAVPTGQNLPLVARDAAIMRPVKTRFIA